jgi:hypothetical protein
VFDVVDVLEVLGSDADLAGASSASLDAMLQHEGVEPALRRALVEGDARTLRSSLRAPNNVCAIIEPAEEEEDVEGEEQDEDFEDDNEDNEDSGNFSKGPTPRG